MRADFFGSLQKDEPLYSVHRLINVAPLRETQLIEVVSRPAALLSARFETESLALSIAKQTAQESAKDAGALPLLSYLLDDMWTKMVARGDGVMRLPVQAIELGSVLADRAKSFLDNHPQSRDLLRRILTLKLATVREDGDPSRRRAVRSEFSDEEWRLVSELADHPNRLLVTASPETGEAYAEVAHEAIFRYWEQLQEWIVEQRDFLIWRSGLESDYHAWKGAPQASKADALLMGLNLALAQDWLNKRGEDIPKNEREFISRSSEQAVAERLRQRRLGQRTKQLAALVVVLLVGMGVGAAWAKQAYLKMRAVAFVETIWPKVLPTEQERTLESGYTFSECSYCPQMVVVPAGKSMIGNGDHKKGDRDEGPPFLAHIAKPFAVSRFETTFDEWDACVTLGGCTIMPPDQGWGRGRQPVIYISWDDAKEYVSWLSKTTGKEYRLLTEVEWEYAARAGSEEDYTWGDKIPKGYANCRDCGSKWDNKQTAPVDRDGEPSFPANKFGLHDMHGNVWEWIEDSYDDSYDRTPPHGPMDPNRFGHVSRGGSWDEKATILRSANRLKRVRDLRLPYLGFRVARTISN
jgi:formylglycine-generating enzyme required for sulfatase activity